MGDSTTIVIFGASGDLTKRKLIPALYSAFLKNRLPDQFNIVGNSRSEFSHDEFRDKLLSEMAEFAPNHDTSRWDEFAQRLWYVPGNVKSEDYFTELDGFLKEQEGGDANRLYYLSTAPFLYEPILENLHTTNMNTDPNGWRRVVIEKPFGYDLESAEKLNEKVHEVFEESQVYRIDHYLGKETAQNLLYFRFANTVFEPIWNRNYIEMVQITVAESVDVGTRASFYDSAGIIRDMFQNHLLQLLALTAMEPPSSFGATALRNEKVKLWQAVHPVPLHDTVRAQYNGYTELEDVEDGSETPTYAALKLHIGNWRWDGVPFYLRSGKALKRKTSEITLQFKNPPHQMFRTQQMDPINTNKITFCIQPDEGVRLGFEAKVPDDAHHLQTVHMDFRYADSFNGAEIPEAYERLLLDAIQGDAALFTRSDGIESQWGIVDPILKGWETDDALPVASYEPGTWGPAEADELLERSGHKWVLRCGANR